jgi:hypothetical protein
MEPSWSITVPNDLFPSSATNSPMKEQEGLVSVSLPSHHAPTHSELVCLGSTSKGPEYRDRHRHAISTPTWGPKCLRAMISPETHTLLWNQIDFFQILSLTAKYNHNFWECYDLFSHVDKTKAQRWSCVTVYTCMFHPKNYSTNLYNFSIEL